MTREARKYLAIGLSIVLMMTLVLGCSQKQENAKQENAKQEITESTKPGSTETTTSPESSYDPLGKYDPEITITTARSISLAGHAFLPGGDWSHNNFYDNYRSQLGINVVNDNEIEEGQYEAKINVLIASGQLPDFFKVTPLQFTQLREADLIEDLTDAYNNYGSDLLKAEYGSVDAIMETVTQDGKIMGLPFTDIVQIGMIWLRKDWREKLGIEKPQTLEDVINLVRAFKDNDLDGDGKNNTIGLSGELLAEASGLRWIFNSFHGYPQIWHEKDGKVVYGSVQPEIRKALEYLVSLYKEGLIDPDFASKKVQQVFDLATSQALGIVDDKQWGSVRFDPVRTKAPNATVEFYPYPSADETPAYTQVPNPVKSIWVVRKGFAHPEAVVKMANFYVEKTWNLKDEEEMGYYVSKDIDGTYYHFRTAAAVNPGVPMEHYKTGMETAAYWDGKLKLEDMKVYAKSTIAMAKDPKQWYMEPLFGKDGSITRLLPQIMDSNSYVSDFYKSVPTPTMEKIWTTLKDKEEEVFMRIVMGEDTIDAFDSFVKDWYSLGGQKIVDEMNARFN